MNWTDTILSNTQLRMEKVIRDLKRRTYGDAEFEREMVDEAVADRTALREPGPPPGTRKRLIPNWAWRKRQR